MNNIKAIRKEQGISVTELATRLNMSQGNLSKIENDQIELKMDVASKIAAALGVSVQAIIPDSVVGTAVKELPVLNPEAINLPPLSRLSIPLSLLSMNKETASALFVQTDDTMSPKIPIDAMVFINKDDTIPTNGVYLIKVNNTICLRRIQSTWTTQCYILCDNSAYQPQQIDISSIEVIGKAISYFNLNMI